MEIVTTALAAVSLISGFMGAAGARQAARAQALEAAQNAKYLREQAEFARYMASLDINAADLEHQRHRGSQESIFAAAGVSLSGSVMQAIGESEKSMEQNHFRRLVAAENDAQYMIKRADMNDRLAQNVVNAGETRAAASILGGVTGAAYWGYKGGMFKGLDKKMGTWWDDLTSGDVIKRDNLGRTISAGSVGVGSTRWQQSSAGFLGPGTMKIPYGPGGIMATSNPGGIGVTNPGFKNLVTGGLR